MKNRVYKLGSEKRRMMHRLRMTRQEGMRMGKGERRAYLDLCRPLAGALVVATLINANLNEEEYHESM